jgi:integrase
MSVKLIKGRYYLDCWPDGKYGRHHREWLPETIKTEEQAKAFERLFLGARRQKRTKAVSYGTVIKSLWPLYAQYIETNYESEHTRIACEDSGRYILRYLGELSVTTLTNETPEYLKTCLRGYISKRTGKHLSNGSINKHLGHLSGFLKYCRETLEIAVPVIRVKYLQDKPKVPVVLTPSEIQRFINACGSPYHVLFAMCFFMALRSHEARYVKWEDFDDGLLTVQGKGGKVRILPVPPFIGKELKKLPRVNDYVFWNPISRKPLCNLRRAMARALNNAHIDKYISVHGLRHSFGAISAQAHQDIHVLQKYLGHSKSQMTEHYRQLFGGSLKELSDRVIDLMDTIKL